MFFVLVDAFSNISLLNFVLVRWCQDVVSMSRVLQFTVFLGGHVVSFDATCDLACLLRPLWHLGGPSSGPGALGGTRRETLGPRLEFVLILNGLRDRISRASGKLWSNISVFFSFVSKSLFQIISRSELGRLRC